MIITQNNIRHVQPSVVTSVTAECYNNHLLLYLSQLAFSHCATQMALSQWEPYCSFLYLLLEAHVDV